MEATSITPEVIAPRVLVWVAHTAVCLLGALAARLSRTGSMLEIHITGRDGAALAPDHVRQILTAPTTEFKAISVIGVVFALVFAVLLRKQGPRGLRATTFVITVVSALIYCLGYGVG